MRVAHLPENTAKQKGGATFSRRVWPAHEAKYGHIGVNLPVALFRCGFGLKPLFDHVRWRDRVFARETSVAISRCIRITPASFADGPI